MTPRKLTPLLTLAAALLAATAASCGADDPSSHVGSQPASPDVSALVVDCTKTALVAGDVAPRHQAAIKLINNMDSPRTFHLVVDGVTTASTHGGSNEMTLQAHEIKVTTYMLRAGATEGECINLDVKAVTG